MSQAESANFQPLFRVPAACSTERTAARNRPEKDMVVWLIMMPKVSYRTDTTPSNLKQSMLDSAFGRSKSDILKFKTRGVL